MHWNINIDQNFPVGRTLNMWAIADRRDSICNSGGSLSHSNLELVALFDITRG